MAVEATNRIRHFAGICYGILVVVNCAVCLMLVIYGVIGGSGGVIRAVLTGLRAEETQDVAAVMGGFLVALAVSVLAMILCRFVSRMPGPAAAESANSEVGAAALNS